jgi:hypothetical protein
MDAASILFAIFVLGVGTVALWPGRQVQKVIAALGRRSE